MSPITKSPKLQLSSSANKLPSRSTVTNTKKPAKPKFRHIKKSKHYPRLAQIGCPITVVTTDGGYQHWVVNRKAFGAAMLRNRDILDEAKFNYLFGCQTVSEYGAYPHDIEAVLERMLSGRLTGTQLIPD